LRSRDRIVGVAGPVGDVPIDRAGRTAGVQFRRGALAQGDDGRSA